MKKQGLENPPCVGFRTSVGNLMKTKKELVEAVRQAIQDCENHGIRVFADEEQVTGAVLSEYTGTTTETIIALTME